MYTNMAIYNEHLEVFSTEKGIVYSAIIKQLTLGPVLQLDLRLNLAF